MINNWEEQFEILEALSPMNIYYRSKKDQTKYRMNPWSIYLENVEIGGDGLLRTINGEGSTFEEAVNDLWVQTTNLSENEFLVKDAMTKEREHLVWFGSYWKRLNYEGSKKEI